MNLSRYQKRTKNLFNPKDRHPFKLSRAKLELFIECPRCFYLDRRLGISRPEGFPFTLNKAVDELLKKEFDIHRAKGEPHPLMKHYKIDAIPFAHQDLNTWRENFTGIQFYHRPTNFIIAGAVDDIWINKKDELIVVDYKATSTTKEISIEEKYRQSFKRQMEIYQWLLRQKGFRVSNIGYFVYLYLCSSQRFKRNKKFNWGWFESPHHHLFYNSTNIRREKPCVYQSDWLFNLYYGKSIYCIWLDIKDAYQFMGYGDFHDHHGDDGSFLRRFYASQWNGR